MATFTFEVKHKPTSENPERCFIYLRITQNREVKRIKSIEINLKDGRKPNEVLNPKAKWIDGKYLNKAVIKEEKEIKKLDSILHNDMQSAKDKYQELKSIGIASATKIKSELKQVGSSESFNAFLNLIIDELDESGRFADWKKFNGFRNKINSFLKSKNQTEVLFKEITSSFLNDFEMWMHTQCNTRQPEKKLNPNTIKLNMVIFKRVINKALGRDVIKPNENPFVAYKMPKEIRTSKDKLSANEIKKFASVDVDKDSILEKAKDTFLFSYYCAGIRFEDIAMIRCGNITEGRLVYVMKKNGKKRDLKLIPEAIEIASRYKEGKQATDYLFGLLDSSAIYANAITYEALKTMPMKIQKVMFGRIGSQNALINKELKMLAKKAEIEKNISFHIARHSFASMAKNQGVNSMKIKGLLAHSKVETTERYMGEFDTDEIDEALAEIFQDGSPKARLLDIINRMPDDEVESLIQMLENRQPSLL